MDNHPWGRIIQREVDGTFDPALGKEAMAASNPPDQSSRARHGKVRQSIDVTAVDLPGSASMVTHGQGEESEGPPEPPHTNSRVEGKQGPCQPAHYRSSTGEQAPDAVHADDGSASGLGGDGNLHAAALQGDGPQRHDETDIQQGSSGEHSGQLAQLPESLIQAGDGSAEVGLGAGRNGAHPQPGAAALEWQDALLGTMPDAHSMEDLPNRPRSPPDPGQLHSTHAQQRQQAGPASRQGHVDNPTPAAQQAGGPTTLSSMWTPEAAQPGSHDPLAPHDAGCTAAPDAVLDVAAAAERQIEEDCMMAFDQAARAMSAVSGRSAAELQGQQRQGLQREQPQPAAAQPAGAAGKAPAPAAASTGQLWGGAAARVMRPTEPLPPASQLDASVLDALPLAMKRELEHAYGESHIIHFGLVGAGAQ